MLNMESLKKVYELKGCIAAAEAEIAELKRKEAVDCDSATKSVISQEREMLEYKVAIMSGDVAEAIEFIDACEDVTVNQAMYYRFLKGNSWDAVAATLGGYNSAEGIRKMVERYLEKMGITKGKSNA